MKAQLPAGWSSERVFVLGRKKRVGDECFRIGGRNTQVRGVKAPGTSEGWLMVANEVRDIRLYRSALTGAPVEVPLRCIGGNPGTPSRIGFSATGFSDNYLWCAALPRPGSDVWDLLATDNVRGNLLLARKLEANASAEFSPFEDIGTHRGVPEVIDWNRNGHHDLLLTQPDGTIRRHKRVTDSPRVAFELTGIVLEDVSGPIELQPPVFPCVVDLHGNGRSDLLVGTGDGEVLLFEDVGDEKEVKLARARRFVSGESFVEVDGSASPTILHEAGTRALIVADGEGAVWAWLIQPVNSVVTTDLAAAFGGESSGISAEYRTGAWWMRPSGEKPLLGAGPEPPVQPSGNARAKANVFDPPAPELRLKPPVTGPHEIHVTLRKPDDVPQFDGIEIRLSDDSSWCVLGPNELHKGARQELFFKVADLTGRDLLFRQRIGALTAEGGFPAYIERVRFVPVKTKPARPRKKRTVVAGISDSIDWYGRYRVETTEDMDDFIGKHEQAGIDLHYEKLGGGCWEYLSRIPEAKLVVPDLPTMSEADKAFCARRIAMHEKINRVELAVQSCHKRGMKCFGWMRLQNHGERIFGKGPLDRFYVEHPEFLEKNLDGTPIPGKLSLGFREVREFHLKLIEEAMSFGADGILMDTMRHLPKVVWADPLVEEFQRKHGIDGRTLPAFDTRVQEFHNEVFTSFLREVRKVMLAKKPDAELHVRVCKPYSLMGCDPAQWAKEGIVEEILIENRTFATAPDIAGLVAALKGTNCRAGAVFCRPHWGKEKYVLHPHRIETEVAKYLRDGARSITFYETAVPIESPEFSRAIRRINHPEALPTRIL